MLGWRNEVVRLDEQERIAYEKARQRHPGMRLLRVEVPAGVGPKGHYHKAYVKYVPDVGKRGRGRPVIQEAMGRPLASGKMNAIAQEMGYPSVTAIPDHKINEFVDRLVSRYGAKSAFGMIQAQIVFRKRRSLYERDGTSLPKLIKIRDAITSRYSWQLAPGGKWQTVRKMPKETTYV
jgi:hypothetical protein